MNLSPRRRYSSNCAGHLFAVLRPKKLSYLTNERNRHGDSARHRPCNGVRLGIRGGIGAMAGESGSFWQLERVNRRRTWALVVKLILAFAVFGFGLDFLFHTVRFSDGRLSGFPWITAVAVILAVVHVLRANFAGADLVLDALDAHPISSDQPKNQAVTDV